MNEPDLEAVLQHYKEVLDRTLTNEATQGLFFRLPPDTKEWLRRTAFEERRSQAAIVLDAVEEYRRVRSRES